MRYFFLIYVRGKLVLHMGLVHIKENIEKKSRNSKLQKYENCCRHAKVCFPLWFIYMESNKGSWQENERRRVYKNGVGEEQEQQGMYRCTCSYPPSFKMLGLKFRKKSPKVTCTICLIFCRCILYNISIWNFLVDFFWETRDITNNIGIFSQFFMCFFCTLKN